jgi:cell division protein FtsI/penicillin-binding protein 2
MVALIRKVGLLLGLAVLACTSCPVGSFAVFADNQNPISLFAQSAARALQQMPDDPEVSYLLFDVRSDSLIASHWDHAEKPIPLGSLVKPVIALVFAQGHQFRYPGYLCKGLASGCWLPHGHGEIGVSDAIALSCNSYFRSLTANMTAADVDSTARTLGIDPPASTLSGLDLVGIGNRWTIAPLQMAHAYLELNRRREQPGVREVVAGLMRSAEHGTGAGVDRGLLRSQALAKTGTAACTHRQRAPGDGFVIALLPAERPRFLLMVRVHGVPGAKAAMTAGKMLHRIEE